MYPGVTLRVVCAGLECSGVETEDQTPVPTWWVPSRCNAPCCGGLCQSLAWNASGACERAGHTWRHLYGRTLYKLWKWRRQAAGSPESWPRDADEARLWYHADLFGVLTAVKAVDLNITRLPISSLRVNTPMEDIRACQIAIEVATTCGLFHTQCICLDVAREV